MFCLSCNEKVLTLKPLSLGFLKKLYFNDGSSRCSLTECGKKQVTVGTSFLIMTMYAIFENFIFKTLVLSM